MQFCIDDVIVNVNTQEGKAKRIFEVATKLTKCASFNLRKLNTYGAVASSIFGNKLGMIQQKVEIYNIPHSLL